MTGKMEKYKIWERIYRRIDRCQIFRILENNSMII